MAFTISTSVYEQLAPDGDQVCYIKVSRYTRSGQHLVPSNSLHLDHVHYGRSPCLSRLCHRWQSRRQVSTTFNLSNNALNKLPGHLQSRVRALQRVCAKDRREVRPFSSYPASFSSLNRHLASEHYVQARRACRRYPNNHCITRTA